MLRIYSLFILLLIASNSSAQELVSEFFPIPEKAETRLIFNPLVSVSARTLPPGRVGFQKAGGANVNSSMLTNALSVGLLSRFEMGVVPMFYITAPGSTNFTGKVNLYKGEEVDWAFSFSQTNFKSEIKEKDKVVESPDLVLKSFQLGMNFHPDSQDFIVSPFLTNVCGYLDSTLSSTYVKSLKCELEWGLDYQWRLKEKEWLTFAYGHLRDSGLSPYESMSSGAGVAWSQFRPSEILSRPSIGIYYAPKNGEVLYLVSTTFYEM
jgi:hypothetical protein